MTMDTPLTAQEIQEKLRSGEYKIAYAPQDYVDQYKKEIHELLMYISQFMIDEEDDPEEWASSCMVSDMSSLGDFLPLADEDTQMNLQVLGETLGFEVERSMYLYEIAARMHGAQ